MTDNDAKKLEGLKDSYAEKFGFNVPENYTFRSRKGLDKEIVQEISWMKSEPDWMRDLRLKAYDTFVKKPMPTWGADLSGINFDDIFYFVRATDKEAGNWDDVPAEIKDTFDKLGIPEAERQFLAGAGAQFECLAGNTRVYTARGPVAIADILPGDIVYAYDENDERLIPSSVKATALKGDRQVFEVKVGTRTIKATENHPFLTLVYERKPGYKRGRYRREWKYLHDLKAGDLVAFAKKLPDLGSSHQLNQPVKKVKAVGHNQFPNTAYERDYSYQYNDVSLPIHTSEDLMWLFGLYLGDGHVKHERGKNKARIEFAIPETDPQLREEVVGASERVFGLAARNGDPYRMTIYSTMAAQLFEANGFTGNAHSKRVPDWVYGLPLGERLAFLGGYLDADGYVRNHPKNRDLVFTSAQLELLDDVRNLAATCGIPSSNIHRFESKHSLDKTRMMVGYRVMMSGPFDQIRARSEKRRERMGKRHYSHDGTSAKGTNFAVHTNEFLGFAKIESIEPAGIEAVYDIEVDGPHNFVAEGLIVHNSEVIYHKIREDLSKQGVIFLSMDDALKEHPDVVKEYFSTVIPLADNKFAALNSAVWSGGSFIYVPKGVHVEMPLQAYFRINTKNMGQFERTLIIVDEGAFVHYVEGCLPPGEQVSLGDRWVNIESVKPGDTVMDSNGMESLVASARSRPFKGDMLTIRPISSANAFQVTPEHPVLAVKRNDATVKRNARTNWLPEVDSDKLVATKPEFVPAGKLERGDFVIFPISKITRKNANFTPQIMRLLGYYLAEGSAYVHNKLNVPVVSFSLGEAETELISEVKSLIKGFTGKDAMEIRSPKKHGVELRVYSQELMDLCVTECGKHAAEKRLSKAVMELPAELQAELLETYFNGDGSVHHRKNTMVRASTASQALAWQLQELLARQGHYATINVRKGGKDTIQGREITRRDQYIIYYSPDKQQSEVRRGDGYFLVPIKGIDRTPYDGPVFNFELNSAPNAYLARGFAVHNCTAPIYSSDSLHSAVVEIIVKPGARCRYTTIQNWSNNVYNLVTKRAVAYKDATMEWVDGNIGSKVTMKYPAVYLMEPGAHGEVLSIAFAGKGQTQDAGGKIVHGAPHTTSKITSKSISKDGGRASYRGLLKVYEGAHHSKSNVVCDALLLDESSRSDTYPVIEIDEQDVTIGHEASVSKVGEEQLFYLMSRGLSQEQAEAMVVNGFIEPLVKELPMEYAMELNRLIQLQMEGSIG